MLNGVGFVLIIGCVFGSFLLSGGKLEIVLHALPHEMMAIVGASVGSFIVANSLATSKAAAVGLLRAFRGSRWKAEDHRDLLQLLFGLLSTFRAGGATGIEPHLDAPGESRLFTPYPRLLADHHLVDFICDYLRMMTINFDDPHQLAEAMENDIDRHHTEELAPQMALQTMADGLPAIGIVAAVLGVIKTMGSIDQPVQVLGGMIGGALVGTFLGVLLAYCLVGPLASKLLQVIDSDGKPMVIAKTAIIAHAQGLPTQVAIEIARRSTPTRFAPSFQQLETALDAAKTELRAVAAAA
jgi:chemotaxis protein MotA